MLFHVERKAGTSNAHEKLQSTSDSQTHVGFIICRQSVGAPRVGDGSASGGVEALPWMEALPVGFPFRFVLGGRASLDGSASKSMWVL